MNDIFSSIVSAGEGLTLQSYLVALGASLLCGLIVLFATAFKSRVTKSFAVTVLLLPAIVQAVIMMVNGNVGTGIAVAGAFSLVRFRSVPGKAREIASIFLAMTAGLASAAGYVALAVLFTAVISVIMLVFSLIPIKREREYELDVTVPESLNFSGVFDGIFKEYARSARLVKTKTSNMGSLYKLTYIIDLKDPARSKEMIDAIRERNGNLEITVSKQETTEAQL
jgi:heme/copper-type cytochrome/quinol oxidase subunit 4